MNRWCRKMTGLFNLKDKKALVTGSSRGIGRSLALGLAEYGADVIVHCARSINKARKVSQKIEEYNVKSGVVAANLNNDKAPETIYDYVKKECSSINILIHNTSVQYRKEWQQITDEEFDTQIDVNLKSSLKLIQLFTPDMKENNWGRIVTVGSVQQDRPHPDMVVYAASKMAQVNMVNNLAQQLAQHGITVNNIAPGVIDTDRNTEALSDDNYKEKLLSNIPLDYIGKPEDCVGTTILLCSDAGRYITGENITIDGGIRL